MWYDKRWMRLSFYLGAMFAVIGVGLAYMTDDYRLAAALTVCLGAALMVYGFMGIMINNYVEQEFRRKRGRSSSRRT